MPPRGNRGQAIDPEYEAMYVNDGSTPVEPEPTTEENIMFIIESMLKVTGLAESNMSDEEKIAELRTIVEEKLAEEEGAESPEEEMMEAEPTPAAVEMPMM